MVLSSSAMENGQRVAIWAASVSGVLALLAGWYVVALGWAVLFLLGESIPMVIYGLVLLAAPALFTIVTIQAFRGRYVSALRFLAPFAVKWGAASVWAWLEGGLGEFVARLPGVSLFTMLEQGYEGAFPLDQVILRIAQFQVEPFAVIVLAAMLWFSGRTTSEAGK